MSTILLKGKPVAKSIYKEIDIEIAKLDESPKLVIIAIGNDSASEFYVNNLVKKGEKHKIEVELLKFPKDVTEDKILNLINELNNNDSVWGIMLQKPLPKQIDEDKITSLISPEKDVDGSHPENIGRLVLGKKGFVPCTPQAVLETLKFYNIETSGKNIVIIGRSNIVGKPLANLLLRKDSTGNGTITVCHSRTKDLAFYTKNADILIAAIGRANFIKENMIKKECIIIDVGINLIVENNIQKYVGDVDYQNCLNTAKMITPVPGGIGTITTSLLLKNVVRALNKNKK